MHNDRRSVANFNAARTKPRSVSLFCHGMSCRVWETGPPARSSEPERWLATVVARESGRGRVRGPGGARGLVSRSRLSQITSCHLGSAGLAPTLSGENTRVNILSFQAPQKIFPGPSLRPAQSHRPNLSLSRGYPLACWEGKSRDVEPAFQKSTLMMLISRGGPGLLRVTRDLAEPFAMPAIEHRAFTERNVWSNDLWFEGFETINRALSLSFARSPLQIFSITLLPFSSPFLSFLPE